MAENARKRAAKARKSAAQSEGDLRDQWIRLAEFWEETAQDREQEKKGTKPRGAPPKP